MINDRYKFGILAYGSLIDNPGDEISGVEINRISCETPFKIEYARSSKGRDGAPTLVPFEQGAKVNAEIIVLNDKVTLKEAENMLYRRETGATKEYIHTDNPGKNKVVIKHLSNFENIETVLYTSIGRNIEEDLIGSVLAEYALNSFKKEAGQDKKDGIHYLLNAMDNGILTPLTKEYKNAILALTNCNSLEEVILKREEILEN